MEGISQSHESHGEGPAIPWVNPVEHVKGTGPVGANSEITVPVSGEPYEQVPRPSTEGVAEVAPVSESGGKPELQHARHVTITDAHGNPVSDAEFRERMEGRNKLYPQETRLELREKIAIDVARDQFEQLAEASGVDITDRLPADRRHAFDSYHPYDTVEAMREDHPDASSSVTGFAMAGKGVVFGRMLETENVDVDVPNLITHETVHDLSRHVMADLDPNKVDYSDGTEGNRTGYAFTVKENGLFVPRGVGLNEAVTDMAGTKIREGSPGGYRVGYVPHHAAMSAVIGESIRRQQMDPKEMEHMLIRGMLVEDNTALNVIEESFGAQGLARVMQTTGDETTGDMIRLTRDLGLRDAAERLERFGADPHKDGRVLNIFDWLSS
jgi:hypothetical protein